MAGVDPGLYPILLVFWRWPPQARTLLRDGNPCGFTRTPPGSFNPSNEKRTTVWPTVSQPNTPMWIRRDTSEQARCSAEHGILQFPQGMQISAWCITHWSRDLMIVYGCPRFFYQAWRHWWTRWIKTAGRGTWTWESNFLIYQSIQLYNNIVASTFSHTWEETSNKPCGGVGLAA
jgi:hypothetical protein